MDISGHPNHKPFLPSLRTKLTTVVLACAIPAVVGFVLLIGHFYDRELAQIKRDNIMTARALMLAVDSDLSSVKMTALALATSPSIAKNDLAAFHAQAKSLLTAEFPGDLFVLSDQTAQELVNTNIPFGRPLPHDGAPEQVRKVFETGKPVVSDIFVGGQMRRPVLAIHTPVWRDGKVVYALAVGFLPGRLSKILDEQRLPPDRIVSIFDTKGVIVARTHESDRFVGKKGTLALLERLREKSEGEIETTTLEGIPVYISFIRSSASGWSVAIGVPRKTILSKLLQSVAWISAVVAILLASGFFLAWSFGKTISRSVKALASSNSETMHNYPMSFSEADEVASELMHNRQKLEKLIEERTAERDLLEQRVIERTEEIRHLAFFDSLTGLPNRRMLMDRLRQTLATSARTGREGALIFIDMDNFKELNDTLGHSMGDLLLQTVSKRLLECIREGDTVARLGGDEFVVMLKDLDENGNVAATQAGSVGQKILAALNQPYDLDGHPRHCTPSIGVTLFADHKENIEELLKRADLAMYQAKAAGRNALRFFDPKLREAGTPQATLDAKVKDGL